MKQPLTITDIVSWYLSKQRLLAHSDVLVVDIRETAQHLPAAAADLRGTDSMGRINGWVSGEFDFEAVRISTGEDIFWEHIKVTSLEDLDGVFTGLVKHMR